jgi:hypothetical protein
MMYGFQSGMCGMSCLASFSSSCIWSGASARSGLLSVTSAGGFSASQGGANQSVSELDSVLPGSSAGEKKIATIAR